MAIPVPFVETPRFPDKISYGSTGGPTFKTKISEAGSGVEQRNKIWTTSRAQYNISHGLKDQADFEILLAFFYAMAGKATGFRYKDWADYDVTAQAIGIGTSVDGGVTGVSTFKLIKEYVVGALTYTRRIFKPIAATVVVSVGGVIQPVGVAYTLDDVLGTITFLSPHRPATGVPVLVTCEFDVPCRFDTDQMSATHDAWQIQSWAGVPIRELIIKDV